MSLSVAPLITREAWLAAIAPITASYALADGMRVYTEPSRYEWTEDGMVLSFRWHHTGDTIVTGMVELYINDVRRVYAPTPYKTLVAGDTFTISVLLPYE